METSYYGGTNVGNVRAKNEDGPKSREHND